MGVKFWTSWRNFREFSKTPSWREFLKNGLKSNFLEKLLRDFSIRNEGEKNTRDFHVKLKVSFNFLGIIFGKILQEISL